MRQVIGHLNYPDPDAHITDAVLGQIMGPNGWGESVTVVTRERVNGKTRLGFALTTANDVPPSIPDGRTS